MTLDPLLNAAPVIQIHTAMALGAVLLTIAIFTAKRGTKLHKVLGRFWVAMMALVAMSSFWILELKIWGNFSPIHLISVYTLVQLVRAVHAARKGEIARHQGIMKGLVFGALIVAGAFTFLPGRTMYEVVLGG
jgi:uncharacterized membrane protein